LDKRIPRIWSKDMRFMQLLLTAAAQDGVSTVNVSKEGGQLLYLKLPGS